MLENFVLSVISGVAVAVILEVLKKYADAVPGIPLKKIFKLPEKPPVQLTKISLKRILLSVGFGFVFSAFAAGILEAEDVAEVTFGSVIMVSLMLAGTLICWIFLFYRAKRK